MKKIKRSKKGFTLIELIVVVAILAILAAVAVPNFAGMSARATEATQVAAAAEVANAININNTLFSGGDEPTNAILIVPGKKYSEVRNSLTAYGLLPSYDATLTDAQVYARISLTSTGVATVKDKGAIGGADAVAAANALSSAT